MCCSESGPDLQSGKKKTDAEILPAHKSPYVWKKNEKHIFQPLSGRVYANSQERIRYYYIDIVNMFFGGISTILFLGPEKFTRPLADQGYLGDGSKTMIFHDVSIILPSGKLT